MLSTTNNKIVQGGDQRTTRHDSAISLPKGVHALPRQNAENLKQRIHSFKVPERRSIGTVVEAATKASEDSAKTGRLGALPHGGHLFPAQAVATARERANARTQREKRRPSAPLVTPRSSGRGIASHPHPKSPTKTESPSGQGDHRRPNTAGAAGYHAARLQLQLLAQAAKAESKKPREENIKSTCYRVPLGAYTPPTPHTAASGASLKDILFNKGVPSSAEPAVGTRPTTSTNRRAVEAAASTLASPRSIPTLCTENETASRLRVRPSGIHHSVTELPTRTTGDGSGPCFRKSPSPRRTLDGAPMPGAILVLRGESGALARNSTRLGLSPAVESTTTTTGRKRRLKSNKENSTRKVLEEGLEALQSVNAFDAQQQGLVTLHRVTRHLNVPHAPRSKTKRGSPGGGVTFDQLLPLPSEMPGSAASDQLLTVSETQ